LTGPVLVSWPTAQRGPVWRHAHLSTLTRRHRDVTAVRQRLGRRHDVSTRHLRRPHPAGSVSFTTCRGL